MQARFAQCYWENVLSDLTHDQATFMAGGAVAQWSDNYCPSPLCAINGTYGWMYPPEKDAVFAESYSKMTWPNAAAAGAAFWNYDESVAVTTTDLQARLSRHNEYVTGTGIG